jgi:hypothetical protein
MSRYQWPSREEWAKQRRTPYWDSFEDLPVSKNLGDYASPEQIAELIAGLKVIYAAEGRKMKEAKQIAGPLVQQPSEKGSDYVSRYLAMTEAEQEILRPWLDRKDATQGNQRGAARNCQRQDATLSPPGRRGRSGTTSARSCPL